MSHYTVVYHDRLEEQHEICEYAEDAFQAIQNSQEDVSFLKDHPHFIDKCIKEE